MSNAAQESFKTKLGNWALALLTFLIFIGGWEAIVRWLDVPVIILPPPSAILVASWNCYSTPLSRCTKC